MRNHTLMQTIARANRVFPGKHSGMIVDYANVFTSLEKALAIYGAGKGGANPVKDKAKLVADLRKAIDAATIFCATQVLKAAIRAQLEKLLRLNKTRADFAEKFEEMIESHHSGSRNIEELFEELVKLSRGLSDEQQRHVRENMTEGELVILDILTRPAPELTTEERAEVKKVARVLLERMKHLLVWDWRQRAASRSRLKLTIEDVLDTGLPRAYDKPLDEQKCSALFEHIYESYPERDAGVYAEAG